MLLCDESKSPDAKVSLRLVLLSASKHIATALMHPSLPLIIANSINHHLLKRNIMRPSIASKDQKYSTYSPQYFDYGDVKQSPRASLAENTRPGQDSVFPCG